MRAIIIAVGTELLGPKRIDTNSLYIARKFLEKGILVDMKIVVGDDMENLTWAIKNACKRAQIVVLTGGLGPTEDDITREAVSNALSLELTFKHEIVEWMREIFKKRGIKMPDINSRQAFVLKGAKVLRNYVGTAPGQYLDMENCKLLILPGPPSEMNPMFDRIFEDEIAKLSNYQVYTRYFKFSGITESETDSRIAPIYAKHRNIRTTILASPGIIEIFLMGRTRKDIEEVKKEVDQVAEKIEKEMKEFIVNKEENTIEEYIVEELKKRNLTLSVAESCTGGGLGNRITNVSGSSRVFLGGVIAYSNDLKINLLNVKLKDIGNHGAVSDIVAKQMAEGIKEITGSNISVSITGIAGPTGGSDKKPVGLVHIHLVSDWNESHYSKVFSGTRERIKLRSINYAFNLIKESIREYDRINK